MCPKNKIVIIIIIIKENGENTKTIIRDMFFDTGKTRLAGKVCVSAKLWLKSFHERRKTLERLPSHENDLF